MLIFNEKTMTKATVSCEFVLCDDASGIAVVGADSESPNEEFARVEKGCECWILNGLICEGCEFGEILFVYFPEYECATTVARLLLDVEKQNDK